MPHDDSVPYINLKMIVLENGIDIGFLSVLKFYTLMSNE